MTEFFDERGSELRDLFFETAQELLQSLNEDALKLESAPQDAEIIRSIRRTVHTLKGDAAAAGFQELSELAHLLEDALAVETPPEGISLAELGFTAADTFSATLAAYQQNVALPDPARLKAFVERLAAGKEIPGKISGNATAPAVWTEYERLAADAARAEGKQIIHLVARIDPLCTMPVAARQLIVNAAGSVSQVLGSRPEAGSALQEQRIDLLLATSQPGTAILAKCKIPTVIANLECFNWSTREGSNKQQETGSTLNSVPPAAARSGPSSSEGVRQPVPRRAPSADTILRVDAERIDNVLNLVGELIIAKSMLQQAIQEYAQRFPKDALRSRFGDAMGFQARVLNDLQRSVMKIRMVPVEQLFRRFPRTARDAALRCGKQVELVISGQETDLDKSLLDAIAEPLTHMVRNAVSHGIEFPEERVAAGKPAAGRIRLDAYHQANQLIVEVSDDGRGMDVEKIRAKALGTGLISAAKGRNMAGAEVLDLIFRPGFSTAEEVTEISGRGVGLDVVRSVLQRLKGSVELETHLGKGTKFRLKLPLTLAIIKALMFRIEQRLYAIPLNTVSEITRARQCDLHHVDMWEVLQLRGQVLPLMRLGERPAAEHRHDKIFVLVISFGERKLGLIVDSLEGEEELVIKAFDDQTVATDLVSGASILGDGRVVLIMNLTAVVERFGNAAARGSFSRAFVPPLPGSASASSSSEVQP